MGIERRHHRAQPGLTAVAVLDGFKSSGAPRYNALEACAASVRLMELDLLLLQEVASTLDLTEPAIVFCLWSWDLIYVCKEYLARTRLQGRLPSVDEAAMVAHALFCVGSIRRYLESGNIPARLTAGWGFSHLTRLSGFSSGLATLVLKYHPERAEWFTKPGHEDVTARGPWGDNPFLAYLPE